MHIHTQAHVLESSIYPISIIALYMPKNTHRSKINQKSYASHETSIKHVQFDSIKYKSMLQTIQKSVFLGRNKCKTNRFSIKRLQYNLASVSRWKIK